MDLPAFDLNLLRVLDALLREGSTVKAGARIGLSQPAVSAALGRLRSGLGDELFFRSGQGLEPTDYAKSLELPLREIFSDIEEVLAKPKSFDPETAKVNFKISGSDYFAEMLMPRLADRVSKQAPGVRVQLVDLVADINVDSVEQNEVDLALAPALPLPGWAVKQTMFRSKYSLIARKGNPRFAHAGLKPGDVVPIDLYCDLGHVLFSPEGKLSAAGDVALAQVGRKRRVVMTMPVFSGVYGAVSESDLIALLPHQLARHVAGKFGLELYVPPMAVDLVEIIMIWHRRSTASPGHRWLRNMIADILKPLDDS
ncbi:DNA-binding transcriptional LysR family regulator [Hoeflea halophila]|uniref:DNA-binding transcriptional LysR family regulator n=1 Tax=Hoeflea halophila TaxID=714899 RepID=A0A286HMX9_9HYPH|nr:LysR family transcriptional regulator [Hoeflea halophila]SOE08514.1 DNA-binding transcriptional LysR family regulator [Hoeflea halophila]